MKDCRKITYACFECGTNVVYYQKDESYHQCNCGADMTVLFKTDHNGKIEHTDAIRTRERLERLGFDVSRVNGRVL